jgi:hypothetical protein
VTVAPHPTSDDGLRVAVPLCDVFAYGAAAEAGRLRAVQQGTTIRALVREVAAHRHISGMQSRRDT